MGATTTTTENARPMFLSADKRKISYRSKNGNLLTLQLTNSKAADSLREVAKKDQVTLGSGKPEAGKSGADQSMWPGLYDTISFWAAEAVEIAFFGPYDEPTAK